MPNTNRMLGQQQHIDWHYTAFVAGEIEYKAATRATKSKSRRKKFRQKNELLSVTRKTFQIKNYYGGVRERQRMILIFLAYIGQCRNVLSKLKLPFIVIMRLL